MDADVAHRYLHVHRDGDGDLLLHPAKDETKIPPREDRAATVAPLVRRIGIVYRGGQQYWFYMQLLAIAETGSPNLSLGCLRALLKNLAHEARLASETEGVDSVGVVYRGLGK